MSGTIRTETERQPTVVGRRDVRFGHAQRTDQGVLPQPVEYGEPGVGLRHVVRRHVHHAKSHTGAVPQLQAVNRGMLEGDVAKTFTKIF